MKKEWAFIVLMAVGGIFTGFAAASFFIYVIYPGLSPYLVTLSEKHDAELMAEKVGWITENINCMIAVTIFLAVLGFIVLLLNLNRHIRKDLFKDKARAQKFIAVIAVEALIIYVLFAFDIIEPMHNLLKLYGSGEMAVIVLVLKFAAIFLLGGLFWLVAGEMGWAGDFSSWRISVQEQKVDLAASFLLGGVIGLCGAVLYVLNDWIFRKYFILVSEVLDKSAEVSVAGIKLITYELMLMTSLSMGIMAGLVVALAPVYRDTRARLKWLIFPGVLFLIAGMIVLPTYLHAVNTYDLGKRDLGEAAGIDATTSVSKTVLFVKNNNEVGVLEWPLQAEYFSTASSHTIAVSSENLEKIRQYLDQHREGSVFQYAAEEALYKGYFVLWDTERALERQFISAKRMLLLRMMLLSRMPSLPVTSKNIAYLRSFTDETKWYAGGDSAIHLAEAFIHFGMLKEGRKWLTKAKELNADPSGIAKVIIPAKPVLKTGVIFGKITANGTPPVNARVALFTGQFDSSNLTHWTLAKRILDVRTLGREGEFTFNNLGEGAYSLAIMTDKTIVPFTISPKKIAITGLPAVLEVNNMRPVVDIGAVDIVF